MTSVQAVHEQLSCGPEVDLNDQCLHLLYKQQRVNQQQVVDVL